MKTLLFDLTRLVPVSIYERLNTLIFIGLVQNVKVRWIRFHLFYRPINSLFIIFVQTSLYFFLFFCIVLEGVECWKLQESGFLEKAKVNASLILPKWTKN